MTWTTTALATTSIDSTADNVATGLGQIKAAVDRVNELSAHPTLPARTAWAIQSQEVVQVVTNSYASAQTISGGTAANIIPLDDTLPQITEGAAVLSQSFTPKSAASTIIIRISGAATLNATSAVAFILALFDGAASAVGAQWIAYPDAAGDSVTNFAAEFVLAAGSTSARTYSLRAGPSASAGTMYLNGNSSGRQLGGASKVTMTITEVLS